MKFSIITPSLGRDSLVRCCESVDTQTHNDFEHIIVFDGITSETGICPKDERRHYLTSTATLAWGNHQRWFAWEHATGDFVIYLDDDNFLADSESLARIASFLQAIPDTAGFALFPIMRHGSHFLMNPPGMCSTDTANLVIRRNLARWPDISDREADGVMAERLKAEHDYVIFPDCAPIIVMEKSSDGK